MSRQVTAEYDFEAQPGSGEMNIKEGEVLTILEEGIEGGWLKGRNTRGLVGLFPESYVRSNAPAPTMIPPTMPPPMPPTSSKRDSWGSSTFAAPPTHPVAPPSLPAPSRSTPPMDDFDDEWTDDDDNDDFGSHDGRTAVSRSQSHGGERHGSKVNKSINRFSNFVKSGMEDFILGASKMNGQPGEKHEIVLNGSTVQWKPLQHPYEATIDNPKKETKLKGLKSFIAYSVTSSLRGLQVGRRYKHFDWLHEQLSAKYIMIPIPPLPEKQVSGRYEEDLLEHRQHILQLWVNKICRHPVLSQSEVWLHFLSSTDEKDWKNGKRKAEKDEYVGGNFLHCVSVPTGMLDTSQVERQLVRFQQSVKSTEDAMKVMQDRMKMFQRLYAEPVKVNWQKLGHAMHTLGNSFQADDSAGSAKVSQALGVSSTVFHKIGESYETHARNDWEPVVEALYTYKGTIQSVPDILNVHKQAVSKLRENEGKLSTAEAEKMKERVDAMSYAVLAEVNHLNSEKVEDTRAMMSAYLRRQAAFHQQIAAEMSRLAAQFDP